MTAPNREHAKRAIDPLFARGGTDMIAGLGAGIGQVSERVGQQEQVNRVILISDGEANEGITSRSGLAEIARESVAGGISVTALGVGVDFDEDTMEQLAENGGGNYRFLHTGSEIRPIFDNELKQLATAVAANPVIQVRLAPRVEIDEVYGYGVEVAADGTRQIRLPGFSSGEHRKVLVRIRVPADIAGPEPVATVGLSYTDLLHDRVAKSQEASLDARITDDAQLADASRDRRAYAQVARMQAVTSAKKAAAYYGLGDMGKAKAELAHGRAQAMETNAFAKDDALGGVVDKMIGASVNAMSQAPSPSSEAGRAAVKEMKQSAYDLVH